MPPASSSTSWASPGSSWRAPTPKRRRRSPGAATAYVKGGAATVDAIFDEVESRLVERWEAEAGLETYGEAVAEVLAFRASEGEGPQMKVDQSRGVSTRV